MSYQNPTTKKIIPENKRIQKECIYRYYRELDIYDHLWISILTARHARGRRFESYAAHKNTSVNAGVFLCPSKISTVIYVKSFQCRTICRTFFFLTNIYLSA